MIIEMLAICGVVSITAITGLASYVKYQEIKENIKTKLKEEIKEEIRKESEIKENENSNN